MTVEVATQIVRCLVTGQSGHHILRRKPCNRCNPRQALRPCQANCNSILPARRLIPPKGREVEFLPTEGIYGNEEITVYRQPDHGCAQARGIGDVVARLVQGVGHQHGDVLQVACQVRRHRHLDDVQDEGTRGGEPVATVPQHNARPKPIVDKPSAGDYH